MPANIATGGRNRDLEHDPGRPRSRLCTWQRPASSFEAPAGHLSMRAVGGRGLPHPANAGALPPRAEPQGATSVLMVRRPAGPSRTTRVGGWALQPIHLPMKRQWPPSSFEAPAGRFWMRAERGRGSRTLVLVYPSAFFCRQVSGVISVTRRNSRLKLDLVWKPTSNITSVTDFSVAESRRQASPIL